MTRDGAIEKNKATGETQRISKSDTEAVLKPLSTENANAPSLTEHPSNY